MNINSEELSNGIITVTLEGRLDVEGTEAIDLKYTALTTSKEAQVIVDMAQVSFIASIGMRTLLSSAKAQANRGGEIVLANVQPLVLEALSTAGIHNLIPVYDDMDAALAHFSA